MAVGALACAACGGGGASSAAALFADPGPDVVARVGSVVRLDGAGSADPEGEPLSYAWRLARLPPGSAATVFDAALVSPRFKPDLPGAYEVELIVLAGTRRSAPVRTTVMALDANAVAPGRPPAAEPRAIGLARVGFLDISPNNLTAPLPTLQLADRILRSVTVVDVASDSTDDPDPAVVAGLHRVDLVVGVALHATLYAPAVATDEDAVAVNFGDGTHVRVVGYAVVGQPFLLDATRSHDDGVVRTYDWTQVEGPFHFATEDPILSVVPTTAGTYKFDLVVTDDLGLSSFPRRLTIPVVPVGPTGVGPPLASIQGFLPEVDDQVLLLLHRGPRQSVSLDGSYSHPRGVGGGLRFAWKQLSGPLVPLLGADTAQTSFVPQLPGTYSFELTVTDSNGVADSARCCVGVASPGGPSPVASLAKVPDQVLAAPGTPPLVVGLDGSASSGPGVLRFRWTQVRGPPCVVDPGSGPGLGLVTIEQAGAYEFELRLFDGVLHSAPAPVSFVVR